MARKRIKSDHCLNCQKPLKPEDNFCQVCGQENDNKRQPILTVLFDILQNFLSLDSKVLGSLRPLIFRPGFLTIEFIKGKRMKYLHPARLFLSIVVGYFLLASLNIGNSNIESNIPVNFSLDTTNFVNEREINNNNDSLETILEEFATDSTNTTISINNSDISYQKLTEFVNNGITDIDVILDSLEVKNNIWNRLIYSWLMKTVNFDRKKFATYLVQKLPWIIFALMPVFALLMKLLYYRHDKYYIDHLIFSFHIHSFVFLIFTLGVLIKWIVNYDIELLVGITLIGYTFIAFRNVFEQSWKKTTLKLFILTVAYSILIIICGLLFLGIAFLLY